MTGVGKNFGLRPAGTFALEGRPRMELLFIWPAQCQASFCDAPWQRFCPEKRTEGTSVLPVQKAFSLSCFLDR